jgi:hypothetical protein
MTTDTIKLMQILKLAQSLEKRLNIDFKEAYIQAKEIINNKNSKS